MPLQVFLTPKPMMQPGLMDIVDKQQDQRYNIQLTIGEEKGGSRLAIKGMVLDLFKDFAERKNVVVMPGSDGPHPSLSSGIRQLKLVQEGQFVNQMGTQIVKAVKGCWEMIWKKDAPAGALLCGFEILEDYKRNEATLPKGKIYLSFPVWTKASLENGREEKERFMTLAKGFLDEKTAFLEKYKQEENIFKKALHYRDAYLSAGKYWELPLKKFEKVPNEDEVISLQDGILLTTKGTVWSKIRGKHVLLGTASLCTVPLD